MDTSITPVSRIPAEVRADGEEGRKLWDAALGFESFLVKTLTQSMTATVGGGEDDETTDSATQTTKDQLPDALATAVQGNGGLGLAEQLYHAMRKTEMS